MEEPARDLIGYGTRPTKLAWPGGARLTLNRDRIGFDRTHIVGSIEPVNPVTIYKVEQIHGR